MRKEPYSKDEQRVADFLNERGVGGGDDPIGFILCSYAFVIEERNALQAQVDEFNAERSARMGGEERR